MRFIVLGAGAVGAVVGALLAQAGHDVKFWLRAGAARPAEIRVTRLAGNETSIRPECLGPGEPIPESDWVLVCVRGEQLDQALHEVVQHMGAERRVAIAAISLSPLTDRARAAGLLGELFAFHVSFGSYAPSPQPFAFTWFPFAAPSMVTPDGVRAQLPAARDLAHTLAAAGLPTQARLSMNTPMRFLVAANSVLALGWDLCDWELTRLARHPELRIETAAAMHESVRLVLPARSPLALLPRFAFAWFLRVFPLLMSKRGAEVWRRHGPKIRAQTEYIARELLALGKARGAPMAALTRLVALSRQAQTPLGKKQP